MAYRFFVSASWISLFFSLWATDEVFSKGCSAQPKLCCLGHDDSCFRSCFCDEFCLIAKDCCSDYKTTCLSGKTTGSPHTRISSLQSNTTTEVILRTEFIQNTSAETSAELCTRSERSTAVTMTPGHTATMQSVEAESLNATTGSKGETNEPPSMVPVLSSQSTTEAIPSREILWSASPQTSVPPTTRNTAATRTPNHTTMLQSVETTSLNATTGLIDTTTASILSTLYTWSTSIEKKTTEKSTSDSVPPFGNNTTRSQTNQQFTSTPRNATEFSSAMEHSTTLSTQTSNIAASSQSEETTLIKTTINVQTEIKNLTVFNITTTSVCLMWEKTDVNESSYLIRILEEPSFNRIVTATSDTVGGLIPGNYYTFVVCVIVGNAEGKNSSISTYTRPESITNLKASNINRNSLTLSWDAPIGNRSFYIVNVIGDIFLTKSTVYESINIGNLTAGSTYLIKVSAVAGDNAIQGNTKQISVRTNQSSLFISIRFSSLLTKPESEQLLMLQINKFLETTFPKQNVTAIWKVERT
ncbi:receptor-type tyrosine-protein phosphatase eta-like isoform X1 [Eleutherodactylus coqui]|uniref:receptor-type tyrosine-protein phosphatase eta-like isoform X1 n=1 Tax=Eleutherodactylus coqui TaxID=57060 RepID=UPI003461FB5E